jgi:hypothetical protein
MQIECFPQLGSSVDLRQDQQSWHVRALEARCAWLEAENKDISRELQELKVRDMEKTAEFEDLVFRLRWQIYKPEIEPEGLNMVAPAEPRLLGKRKHPKPSGDDVDTHRRKRIRYG